MRAVRSALVLACAIAGVVYAGPADDAFKKGRELRKQQKWAEACAAFEESQRLDPQLGTQFNIAECDAKLGKLATALALYKEIIRRDTNATRKSAATDLAKQLEPRVPKLQIQIDPKPPGLAVTINKKPASDPTAAQLVDFGTYDIVASAPGFDDASTSVKVAEEAKVLVIALRMAPRAQPQQQEERPKPAPPAPKIGIQDQPAPAPSHRKRNAVIAFAVGGVAGVGGTILGLGARNAWNDAKAVCEGATECTNAMDAAEANELADTARGRGNLATLAFVLAGASVGTGIYLWVTAPRERAVAITVRANGVALVGRF